MTSRSLLPETGALASVPSRAPPTRCMAVAILVAGLFLAACAGSPVNSFDLTAANPPAARALRAPLRIAEPTAGIDLDSDRILVRTGPQEVATLAGAKWSDRLPLLVQSRLIQTFQNAHLMDQVGRRVGTSGGYELDLDIRAFELDAAQSRVKVDVAVKLVAREGGHVVAAQMFTAEEPVASPSAPAVTAALDGALDQVMTQIVAFASTKV
jgi:cholesterol transport system auxiliary component